MKPDQIPSFPILSGQLFDSLPESIRSYIRYLESTIQHQQVSIQQLEARVHELEARLSKDSSNSSKPPGSDGLKKKIKSLRGKSDKKPGAQQGHVGKGLAQVGTPDFIITHTPTNCHGCGLNLSQVDGACSEKRQVFDIPQPKIEVTEHQALEKKCPCCGELTRGAFPDHVRGPVQYGERVQALTAYFAHQHFIPVDRVCQIFEDVFGITISPGTCSNVDERLFRQLESFESSLKTYLLAARVLHFDEAGILPRFQGIGIHDHWFPYFAYQQITHGLCNAHHLRELTFTFINEQEKEDWAKRMKDLLIFAKNEVEGHLEQGALPQEVLLQIEETYGQIIAEGLEYHSLLPPLPKGKRGRQKQRDGKNLLDRLKDKRGCVLRFMYDFSVNFTNNLGEQDIRMVKLKQKISGCFRIFKGGQIFCRIRSYISTARKQGWDIWEALAEAVRGCPRLLAIHQENVFQTIAV
ncbi:MAG: transposase [Parachlamydiales bacterium]|jgi:transposase